MMKKILILLLLFVGYNASSQVLQKYYTPIEYQLAKFDSLAIPKDTFSVPTGLKKLVWLASKANQLYLWDTTLLKWSPAGGSTGSPNSNIGSDYRLAVPNTNNIKTLYGATGILIDSSTHANALTFKADTAHGSGLQTWADNTRRLDSLKTTVGNFANTDLSFTGNRAHNARNYNMNWDSVGRFEIKLTSPDNFNYYQNYFLLGRQFGTNAAYADWYTSTPTSSARFLFQPNYVRVGSDSLMEFTGSITRMDGSNFQLQNLTLGGAADTLLLTKDVNKDQVKYITKTALKNLLGVSGAPNITLTTTGSSGPSTYNSTTGALNIPNYTLSGLGYTIPTFQQTLSATSGKLLTTDNAINVNEHTLRFDSVRSFQIWNTSPDNFNHYFSYLKLDREFPSGTRSTGYGTFNYFTGDQWNGSSIYISPTSMQFQTDSMLTLIGDRIRLQITDSLEMVNLPMSNSAADTNILVIQSPVVVGGVTMGNTVKKMGATALKNLLGVTGGGGGGGTSYWTLDGSNNIYNNNSSGKVFVNTSSTVFGSLALQVNGGIAANNQILYKGTSAGVVINESGEGYGRFAAYTADFGAFNILQFNPSGQPVLFGVPSNDGYQVQIENGLSVGTHIKVREIAAPATPSSGAGVIYAKSDGHLYYKSSAGVEKQLDN